MSKFNGDLNEFARSVNQAIADMTTSDSDSDTIVNDSDTIVDESDYDDLSVDSIHSDSEVRMPSWGVDDPTLHHNLGFVLTTPTLIREAVDSAVHDALHMDSETIAQLVTVYLIQREIHCWCCAILECGVLSYPTNELANVVDDAVQRSFARCRDAWYCEGNENFLKQYIANRIEGKGNCDLDDVFCVCDCC